MLQRIDELKLQLRSHPLVPLDPRNSSEPLLDMASGVRLPDIHCAFQGCTWCVDMDFVGSATRGPLHWEQEWRLFFHLITEHRSAFGPELKKCDMEDRPLRGVPRRFEKEWPYQHYNSQSKWQCDLFMEVHSVYMAAVCERERESMPVIGIAKDRQVLRGLNAVLPQVRSMMCFGCAQIRSHAPLW